ncbi:MAG TPA: hypothetical protein EYM55_05275 [Candidatus Marinimicrobia bacterium]|nr:hypothetical protein [Candidatus Neomarinimicrobiota bacterium]
MCVTTSTSLNYYYLARNLYQYVYSKPVYRELGGEFLAWTRDTHFKLYQHFFLKAVGKSFLGILPRVKRIDRKNIIGLEGVLIANTLHELGYDHDKLKSVLMYHGTSDKVPRVPQQVANQFDYYLLSGPKNEAKLSKASGISLDSSRLVRVGNWMFDPVVQQNYDLVAIRARFGIKDTSRPTVLYAPTWGYGGGTLLKYGPHFLRTIPQKYNLIVRPHYGETNYLPELAKMVPHNLRKWVTFVRPAHIFRKSYIDNMLIADLLISETSSMIYEYLITRRPIIIAETETNEVDMDDDGMSVYHIADHYSNGDDILGMIQKNLDDKSIPQYMESLLKKFFYFNDGKSTQRCLDFLRTLA